MLFLDVVFSVSYSFLEYVVCSLLLFENSYLLFIFKIYFCFIFSLCSFSRTSFTCLFFVICYLFLCYLGCLSPPPPRPGIFSLLLIFININLALTYFFPILSTIFFNLKNKLFFILVLTSIFRLFSSLLLLAVLPPENHLNALVHA